MPYPRVFVFFTCQGRLQDLCHVGLSSQQGAECGELVACPVLRKKKHNWFWSSHPRVILPPYVQYTLIYLHLALFSAHSSFHLDLRSFWLFMLTWPRKRAFVSWWTGIYAFFPGIYAYFPGKYAHNFGFKMHKAQKCQKWCNYAHVAKKSSESRNLSNEHLFVLFRGYIYIYILYRMYAKYKHIYVYYIYTYDTSMLTIDVPKTSFEMAWSWPVSRWFLEVPFFIQKDLESWDKHSHGRCGSPVPVVAESWWVGCPWRLGGWHAFENGGILKIRAPKASTNPFAIPKDDGPPPFLRY